MAKGDHLKVCRGLLDHHGIYCGDGTVVHYTNSAGPGKAKIRRDDIGTFANGGHVVIVPYAPGTCFSPEKTVELAESRLGEQEYNLVFRNCEHFATWCKTGEETSSQVRDAVLHLAASFLGSYLGGGDAPKSTAGIARSLGQLLDRRAGPQVSDADADIAILLKEVEKHRMVTGRTVTPDIRHTLDDWLMNHPELDTGRFLVQVVGVDGYLVDTKVAPHSTQVWIRLLSPAENGLFFPIADLQMILAEYYLQCPDGQGFAEVWVTL